MRQPIARKTPPRLPTPRAVEIAHAHETHATPSGADRDDPFQRFDTSGIDLLEDVVDARGFDPYGHGTLRSPRPTQPRTDLRALSAQILAERAARKK
jgi:hypothetical protein